MEYGYSVLMGIFALMLLLYAGLMALTRDYKILPLRAQVSVKPKNEKKYMLQMAKAVALTALAPALSALAGLFSLALAGVILIAGVVLSLWGATTIVKNEG